MVMGTQRVPTISAAVSLNPTTLSTTLGGVRLMSRKTPPIAPWANSPTRWALERLRSTKAIPTMETRQTMPARMMITSIVSQGIAPHSVPVSVRRSKIHSRINATPGAPKVIR